MNTVELSAQWTGDELSCIGTDRQGKQIKMGGKDGYSPGEVLLLSLASCMMLDVVNILQKRRQHLTDVSIALKAHQPEKYPMPYKVVEVVLTIVGENISEQVVQKAIELTETTYCTVGLSLKEPVEIQTTYRIETPTL